MSASVHNYSLFVIPVAWLVAYIPHLYATSQSKLFDHKVPRTYVQILQSDQTIDNVTRARIIRCEGAHANGFENLGFFATSVLAGNFAGLPVQTLNALSAGYVMSRILYNFIYISDMTAKIPKMRSTLWLVGIVQIITLYVKSGIALRNGPVY